MDRTEEYLAKIRELNGLKRAILRGVTISKKNMTAEFSLVTDLAYTDAEAERARTISAAFLPQAFTAKVSIVKRVPDEQILKRCIYKYVSENFPAAAAFMKEDDILIELLTVGAHFYFCIASGDQSLFSASKILDSVSAYLKTLFCGAFYGDVKIIDRQRDEAEVEALLNERPEETEEEFIPETRYFPIEDFKKLDGVDEIPKQAVYIADHSGVGGVFSVCGTIQFFEEKKYVKHNEKTGEDVEKSRFSVSISDGTGNLRTTYFPKKATVEKILELKQGDSIVLTGENEEFNGNLSFKASKINYGRPPEGFTPVPQKSRPVPKFYKAVHPEPYKEYSQAGLFDDLSKPQAVKNDVFVVFDLETTGLIHQPSMGKIDKIIEIGAVKIVNGELTEKFSSFVACKDKLPEKIVELTGIHDEDLVGAPPVEEVIADFFKFANGAYLVGHNVTFDYDFIKYYGKENQFAFENYAFDTVTIAQEVLRGEVPNYKLNTIADYYGFSFNHHRAFDDSCVTAKIFIELIKRRGSLPKL